jgi:catechol 2,3-dioxygenase-like lactoylglutathione lyase family enzyme
MPATPALFRVILEVSDLDTATAFYTALLGTPGRRVSDERHYFDCGPAILAIHDPRREPRPAPQPFYLASTELETLFARARDLDCLSPATVHGDSAGAIVMRPWGERSFYAIDPGGNELCFVDAATIFTGQ